MGVNYNPKAVTDGLVLCLDAANAKSYDTTHNLMFYSGVQGASGATKPTSWLADQGFGTAVDTSNNTSLTIDGVGYWQFDIVGTTSTGNYLLLSQNQFIGVVPGTTYTITYNYSLPVAFSTVSSLSSQILWYNAADTFLSSSQQFVGYFTTWNRSTNLAKSSYSGTAPAGAVKARVRIFYHNPHPVGTTINYTGFRLGGVQLNIGSSATSYVATTATQVLPTTVWYDISGTNNHGTFIGSPTFNSANGGSIVFTASVSDYVNLTSASLLPTGTSDRTIIAFVRTPTSFPYNFLHVIHWGHPGTAEAFGLAVSSSGSLTSHAWGQAPIQGTVATGTIYCLAVSYTHSSTLHRFWINGVSQGTGVALSVNTGTTDARVGMRIFTPAEQWGPDGRIYNVMVYNRALSEQEIKQNFNAVRGRYGI